MPTIVRLPGPLPTALPIRARLTVSLAWMLPARRITSPGCDWLTAVWRLPPTGTVRIAARTARGGRAVSATSASTTASSPLSQRYRARPCAVMACCKDINQDIPGSS